MLAFNTNKKRSCYKITLQFGYKVCSIKKGVFQMSDHKMQTSYVYSRSEAADRSGDHLVLTNPFSHVS